MNDNVAIKRGFYYKAFDIYGGLAGLYEYGPIAVRIRENIKKIWRWYFIDYIEGIEIESVELGPEIVFKASQHIASFTDPIVICKTCNTPYRADKLLEEFFEKRGLAKEADEIKKMNDSEIEKLIKENNIKCEKCGGELSKVDRFNLMFKTNIGYNNIAYLRPETAQNIFVDFIYLYKVNALKLPVGIGQIGHSFRNEISPRQELVRMRNFTQMELELFFDPDSDQKQFRDINLDFLDNYELNIMEPNDEKPKMKSINELLDNNVIPNRYFAFILYIEDKFLRELGFSQDVYRYRVLNKEELPHYSGGNIDLEIKTRYGYIECAGNAYRKDFDLKQHSLFSNKELMVNENGRKFIPHVIEPSIGLDRIFFALLENNFVDDGRGWQYLRLNEDLAPYKYAIFPLQKDDKLIEKAKDIFNMMQFRHISSYYSDSGSIGKRYAKADEIGVPYDITIDYQTLEDNTVTIRNRDDAKQKRIKVNNLFIR